jgi:hypothetical protein
MNIFHREKKLGRNDDSMQIKVPRPFDMLIEWLRRFFFQQTLDRAFESASDVYCTFLLGCFAFWLFWTSHGDKRLAINKFIVSSGLRLRAARRDVRRE